MRRQKSPMLKMLKMLKMFPNRQTATLSQFCIAPGSSISAPVHSSSFAQSPPSSDRGKRQIGYRRSSGISVSAAILSHPWSRGPLKGHSYIRGQSPEWDPVFSCIREMRTVIHSMFCLRVVEGLPKSRRNLLLVQDVITNTEHTFPSER